MFLSCTLQRSYNINNTKDKQISNSKTNFLKKYLGVFIITSLIVICFLLLYSNGNPIVSEFLSKIDVSFIEFGFVIKMGIMFLLLFGLVNYKTNEKILIWNKISLNLTKTGFTHKVGQEYQIVYSSFWIVSGLLFLINIMDLFVVFSGKLPQNITYSKYIHQGFNTFVFTLSLSIGLIIYFFRGQINFHKNIKALRKVSCLWIFQNLILVFITTYKNFMYVETYGLTYKRIFVFVCLIFVFVGLLLSFDKVKRIATNWSYFNKLSRHAFFLLILLSMIPFDLLITN